MYLLQLSDRLTVDIDKIIAIRPGYSTQRYILVFAGGDTIDISETEYKRLELFSSCFKKIGGHTTVSESLMDVLKKFFEERDAEEDLTKRFYSNYHEPKDNSLKKEDIYEIVRKAIEVTLAERDLKEKEKNVEILQTESVNRLHSDYQPRPWHERQLAELKAYIAQGHSFREAAETFGISERTIYRKLKDELLH